MTGSIGRHHPRTPQVIKVGTSSLVRPEQQTLNLSNLARIAETVKALHSLGGWGPLGTQLVRLGAIGAV